jgi:Ca2+/Na+ antiporter
MQILGRVFKGEGTFEQTMSVLALSISVAMVPALIHDLPMSFFSALKIINAQQHEIAMNQPTIWRTLLWFFYSLYFIYFFVLFPKQSGGYINFHERYQ